ncbi:MAG: TraR/DksA family transcriptional regulator [Bacteroidetes bacterium]|nr:TraR/DksA family transcriptional regulator [Bacteroidota bacterium]MBL7103419.1 TraR/DksA family transcriptional regulator [Bacteroidales bacterium]
MTKEDTTTKVKKTRYSDGELEEFRQIILEKLEKAREDLKMLTDAYSHANEHDTTDTSPTFKVLEEGYQVLSKEENSRLASRQQKFINSLENALIRIENQTYGICRVTGKLISKERLRSVPHATLSIDAKLNRSQKK